MHVIYLSTTALAQGSCYNIGFEHGNLDGFDIYHGSTINILNESQLVFGTDQGQHVIQKRIDGYDEIALANCITNSNLPVVGQGLGEYSLRLGDSEGGQKVSRIVKELDVHPENNFLILSYAVILEDPEHEAHEQPRFVFKIKDINDNVLSCGEYEVFASQHAEGFENCGDWRVRPWTTAGFELDSYIGETIRLEITILDCGLGQHGGYAYIDMTCRPLEIILSNYCNQKQEATMTITEGFDDYLWNTGDTTNEITILNPMQGDVYTVQVVSASGCSISLSDTIPLLESLPLAKLYPQADTVICNGSSYYFYPAGENIARLELIGSGLIYDSILINSLTDRTFSFVASDEFGCESDTMSFLVTASNTEILGIDVEHIWCPNEKGSVLIHTTDDDGNIFTLDDGFLFQDSNFFDELSSGEYSGFTVNEDGCKAHFDFFIESIHSGIEISPLNVQHPSCGLENGIISCVASNGKEPYLYSTDNINYFTQNVFANLEERSHWLYARDELSCVDSMEINLIMLPEVKIELLNIEDPHCNQITGQIEVVGKDGIPPFSYSLDNGIFTNDDGIFLNVSAGTHTVYVKDSAGCEDYIILDIVKPPTIIIQDLVITNDICGRNEGGFSFTLEGGSNPFQIEINNDLAENNFSYTNLESGHYFIKITDDQGCTITEDIVIDNIPEPVLNLVEIKHLSCGHKNGQIILETDLGTVPYQYAINGGPFQHESLFKELSEGIYQIEVVDMNGCSDNIELQLNTITPPEISHIEFELDECNDYRVTIMMRDDIGCHPYRIFYLEEEKYFEHQVEITLPPGDHELIIVDDCLCTTETSLTLENVVEYYIPNIISSGSNNGNNRFKIFKNEQAKSKIKSIRVYDRWGSLVFEKQDINFDTENIDWWDGTFNGQICPNGVYIYGIEIIDSCNRNMLLNGDVTLLD